MGSHAKIVQDGDHPAESEGQKTQKTEPSVSESPRKRYVVKARPLFARPGLSFDKIEELLDEIEGPWRR